jgi:hypothetical protein
MSLIAFETPPVQRIPKNNERTLPIEQGQAVMATSQKSESTGFFGWLDDIGGAVGEVAGRAVDTVAGNWIEDLDIKNSKAVKTPDVTPVASASQIPLKQSFMDANKTYIMYGGFAVVGIAALILAFRK